MGNAGKIMNKKSVALAKAPAPPEAPFAGAAVLVVDDHRAAAEALGNLLQARGYEVYVAFDADTGLKILADKPVDAVIGDMILPGIDGINFLSMVKKRWPTVPFIILTGFGTIETAVEATRRGAYEYLTKPVEP